MTPQKQVEQCLSRMIGEGRMVGASVLVRHHHQEVLYAQSGHADREQGRLLARDDLFRMYSQTKPVTAAAAMLLVERGVIDLMDPVEKYLPGFHDQKVVCGGSFVPAERPVVVMDLLGMSAGLVYGGADVAGQAMERLMAEHDRRMDSGDPMTTVELANRIGEQPLAFQPGTAFRYSTCADVLGAVIEVADGRSFSRFLREEFFEPLGMEDTAFFVPPEKRNRLTVCYERTEAGLVPCAPRNAGMRDFDAEPAFASGGAGLISTIDDYAAFAQMLLDEGQWQGRTILAPQSVRYLTSPQLPEDAPYHIWHGMEGFSYGKLMRCCVDPGQYPGFSRTGEYGWDGWLGVYFANLPREEMTILMMMAVKDTGTSCMQRRVRNVVLALESLNLI